MGRAATRGVGTADAIVIGSGFGGSVAAWRFATAGRRVILLERGRLYPPGSFARSAREMSLNLWDPSKGLLGLFDIWSFRTIDAIVASGVGGGSLIYANVLLRKDANWFVERSPDGEHWPLRRTDLEPHYDRVEAMLAPQLYPIEAEPYARTPKTRAFADAARAVGLHWCRPPLAVTFANPGRPPVPGEPIDEPDGNLHGCTRLTCRLCGECVVGCNAGSKNTLDFTFLSAADRCNAATPGVFDLRHLAEARRIEPKPDGGFRVRYRDLADGGAEVTLEARVVVLAAGSLGSTYLLLRNRDALTGLGNALGTRFSGNGDLLGFVQGCREEDGRAAVIDPTFGPTITSAIRSPDELDGAPKGTRGFYLEDGGFPPFVSWIAETANAPAAFGRKAGFILRYLKGWLRLNRDTNLSAEFQRLIGRAELTGSALVMLGMGRDVAGGRMKLDGRYLDVDWPRAPSQGFFAGLRATMAGVARAQRGHLITDPLAYIGRGITVHPLGGCPMGEDPGTGVVDPHGEVFGHPGLFVADGSVMPGPVGPNPALTIAALSDRFADRALDRLSP